MSTMTPAEREALIRGAALGADLATGLTLEWDDEHTFPFTEDENANITGYGHQDPETFAAAVNLYDELATGSPLDEVDQWTADDIAHHWITIDPDNDERVIVVDKDAPGAMPVTTLWGAR